MPQNDKHQFENHIISILSFYNKAAQKATKKYRRPVGSGTDIHVADNYRYFFISSDAFAISSEMENVRFMLLTSAKRAAQARNSSTTS